MFDYVMSKLLQLRENLYYIVWIRYFIGGRDAGLLSKSFCLVPMPLAVFPVLYFICAALWLHNIPAVITISHSYSPKLIRN